MADALPLAGLAGKEVRQWHSLKAGGSGDQRHL